MVMCYSGAGVAVRLHMVSDTHVKYVKGVFIFYLVFSHCLCQTSICVLYIILMRKGHMNDEDAPQSPILAKSKLGRSEK